MNKPLRLIAALLLAAFAASASAAETSSIQDLEERLLKLEAAVPAASSEKPWFDKISLRGYIQLRYNRLFESNDQLKCEQCDKSLGSSGQFFVRRARLVISGDVHDRVYLYIQPDFASDASATSLHFTQLRDLYADLALDDAKEFRIRVGQSKIPYGFENLQSSQNRLPLDRNDALNSAVANERDLGAFFYWAPEDTRKRLSALVSSGLKGSGDYGVLGLGVYNGQTPNRPEANDSLHAVARLAYPFRTEGGQYIEAGVQGYMGRYVVATSQRTSAAVLGDLEHADRRVAGSFIVYPQPFGVQAEWNFGVGPEYDPTRRRVVSNHLQGGYVQTMYMIRKGGHILTPFVRGQYYSGGKKHETDARRYLVRQAEGGVEWQPNKNFELVVAYSQEDRAFQDDGARGQRQKGNRMRIQAQINY
ncbi:MAG: OprO/OprP family phosphate-selective porin [Elusimicrobiota bacterium]|nr:MAG: OprO/OprP family phosphate-selective porin [Elusimicrobiota bacterium]